MGKINYYCRRFCIFFAKLASILVILGCKSAPQKVEIPLPAEPKMPAVYAAKVDGGILISEKDFVALVQYIERMKGHAKELNACVKYYKGE